MEIAWKFSILQMIYYFIQLFMYNCTQLYMRIYIQSRRISQQCNNFHHKFVPHSKNELVSINVIITQHLTIGVFFFFDYQSILFNNWKCVCVYNSSIWQSILLKINRVVLFRVKKERKKKHSHYQNSTATVTIQIKFLLISDCYIKYFTFYDIYCILQIILNPLNILGYGFLCNSMGIP